MHIYIYSGLVNSQRDTIAKTITNTSNYLKFDNSIPFYVHMYMGVFVETCAYFISTDNVFITTLLSLLLLQFYDIMFVHFYAYFGTQSHLCARRRTRIKIFRLSKFSWGVVRKHTKRENVLFTCMRVGVGVVWFLVRL